MPTDTEKVTLTIFTPTYNRAHLLPRLYESIKSQVRPDELMEWLVIDDGSTDGTFEIIDRFTNERPDLVRYTCVENGGKHRAINLAAELAHGDWIMIVDSDDRLLEGAINHVLETIRRFGEDTRVGLLRGLRQFPELATEHRFDVRRNPCRHDEWISFQRPFDTAEVIRRTALQLHPFPDYPGEKFMAEGWLWHNIDQSHLTFFISSPWVECFYQDEGLSASSRHIRAESPCGAMAVYAAMLDAELSPKLRARASINWWRYRFHAGKQCKTVISKFRVPVTFAPLGWLVYLWDWIGI